jgi:hypothetical protein
MGADHNAGARAYVLVTVCALVIASCGSTPKLQSPSTCEGGHYCVGVDVTGQLSGRLATAPAPGNFRAICTVLPKPHTAWVAHVYGTLQRGTWLLVVQTNQYTGPASYSANVTLGKLVSGTSKTTTSDNYIGQGTAKVGAGKTSADITADLNAQPGGKAIHLSGILSCDKFTTQD